MLALVLFLATALCYVIATALVLRCFAGSVETVRDTAAFIRRSTWLALGAILLHAALISSLLEADHFDHLNLTASLSIVSCILALLVSLRTQGASLLLRPVVYIFAALAAGLMTSAPVDWGSALGTQPGLIIHIGLSLLAYGVLMLATLYAIELLYINKLIKQRRARLLSRMIPPLLTVERYFFRLLTLGTLLLIVAIGSGFVFLNDMFAQNQAHKTILSLVALALYLIVALIHKLWGVRGRSVVITAVVASAILTLAYFGSRIVKDVIIIG